MASRQCYFGLRFCQCRAGPQTPHNVDWMRRAIMQVTRRVLAKRRVHFRFVSVELESGGRDADNGVVLLVKNDGAAEHIGSSVELVLPEAVAKDGRGTSANLVFFGQESAAERKGNAQNGK